MGKSCILKTKRRQNNASYEDGEPVVLQLLLGSYRVQPAWPGGRDAVEIGVQQHLEYHKFLIPGLISGTCSSASADAVLTVTSASMHQQFRRKYGANLKYLIASVLQEKSCKSFNSCKETLEHLFFWQKEKTQCILQGTNGGTLSKISIIYDALTDPLVWFLLPPSPVLPHLLSTDSHGRCSIMEMCTI